MNAVNKALAQKKITRQADWLAHVPVPIFGAALGLLGLSLIVAMNPYLVAIPLFRITSLMLGSIVLVTGILIHLMRLAIRRDAFLRDFRNSAIAPFFGQIGIAILLLAEGTREFAPWFAHTAFIAGSSLSLLLVLYWLWMNGRHKVGLSSVSPGWLVPPIALLYIGLLAPAFDMTVLIGISLIAGSVTAVGVLGLIVIRLLKGPSLPPLAKPGLAISVAIPALMLLALLESDALQTSWFTTILFGITVCSYLVSLIALVKIIIGPFSVSWWAFGMPLIAAAIAFSRFSSIHASLFLTAMAHASAFVGAVIVSGLSIVSLVAVQRHMQ